MVNKYDKNGVISSGGGGGGWISKMKEEQNK